MGSIKKALKPITRVVDNIIPNEIKPALPYLAATFGAPYLAGTGLFGGIGNLALRKGLAGALTNVGTQALLGQKINPVSAAVSGLTIGGGEFIKPANIVGPPTGIQSVLQTAGDFLSPDKIGSPSLATFSKIGTAATVPVTAGTIEATQNAAIEANNAYEAYLKEQQDAENKDIMTRVDFITRYLKNAGFDQSTIDERLNELGYAANGGLMGTRVGFSNGGSLGDSMQSMKILLMKNEILAAGGGGFGGKDLDDKTDDEIIEIYEAMFGESKASGGRVGLAFGGMDPRGGKPTGDSILDSLIEESIDEETPPKGIMAATDFSPLKIFQKSNEGRVRQLFQQIEDGENVSEAMAELFNVYGIDLYPKNAEGGDVDFREKLFELLSSFMSKSRKKEDKILGPREKSVIDQIMDAREKSNRSPGELARDDLLASDSGTFRTYSDPVLDKVYLENFQDRIKKLYEERNRKAEGGIMDLKVGGMPAEMDLRGGGFVPIGAKEKADDVPARLSKNEFVMTADAVRAAGGGSVNKGAKRMYDLMNKLEAKV